MWPFRKQPAARDQEQGPKAPPAPDYARINRRFRDGKIDRGVQRWRNELGKLALMRPAPVDRDGRKITLDESLQQVKALNNAGGLGGMPEMQFDFFNSYGFIGHQTAAFMAQHWLIKKACWAPGEDAVRNGFKITFNGGDKVPPDAIDAINAFDSRMGLNATLREFVGKGNVFGVRVGIFKVKTGNPERYYLNPFNPDAVTPGSYQGIAQVDPYWCLPELDYEAASDPSSRHFYEPTWWQIGGRRYHRSHLCIYRTCELPDILKPAYLYGGIPLPQLIAERVYNAERTANEAPRLALNKRMRIMKTDLNQAMMDEVQFREKIDFMTAMIDNHGFAVGDIDDQFDQKDTALADFDAVVMTQYQLVAAAAEVPSTKLLGTSPKGFSATGEYDEASYHERLAGVQENSLTPLVSRHHELVWRSEIAPLFGLDVEIKPCVTWNPLDETTASELADLNLKKAQTAQSLASIGAIDGFDERERLIADPDSGYSGMSNEPEPEPYLPGSSSGAPPAKTTAEAVEAAEQVNMNGAQIASMLSVLGQVSEGTLPKTSAKSVLTTAFPISPEKADELLSDVGGGNGSPQENPAV